jgi:TM2 domain-containing membrane protein YozV/RNA polymerase subunit RPABC4/transcription elongation factor Spt4
MGWLAYCPNCGKPVEGSPAFCPSCGKSIQWATTPIPQAFCPHCGAAVDPAAEICPKCGVRIKQAPQPAVIDRKNPGIAAVLSFLFTGLGQIYNGQIGKGIIFVVVGIVCLILVVVLIGIILYPLFWIYNIYDAYTSAKKINAGIEKPD